MKYVLSYDRWSVVRDMFLVEVTVPTFVTYENDLLKLAEKNGLRIEKRTYYGWNNPTVRLLTGFTPEFSFQDLDDFFKKMQRSLKNLNISPQQYFAVREIPLIANSLRQELTDDQNDALKRSHRDNRVIYKIVLEGGLETFDWSALRNGPVPKSLQEKNGSKPTFIQLAKHETDPPNNYRMVVHMQTQWNDDGNSVISACENSLMEYKTFKNLKDKRLAYCHIPAVDQVFIRQN